MCALVTDKDIDRGKRTDYKGHVGCAVMVLVLMWDDYANTGQSDESDTNTSLIQLDTTHKAYYLNGSIVTNYVWVCVFASPDNMVDTMFYLLSA